MNRDLGSNRQFMKFFFIFCFSILFHFIGCTQSTPQKQHEKTAKGQKVGGNCEGCEAIYESSVPFEKLSWVDTLPDFQEQGPKLVVSGVVYKPDGKTPAPGVVVYIYHTDQTGNYSKKGGEKGWGLRHGYIRGWVKTNERGEYQFYTLRPASYPNSKIPAHIHPVIKEPGVNEYYIDEYLFDDDPLLSPDERQRQEGRGGNAILKLEKKDGIYYGKRNIYLGKNIPDYDAATQARF